MKYILHQLLKYSVLCIFAFNTSSSMEDIRNNNNNNKIINNGLNYNDISIDMNIDKLYSYINTINRKAVTINTSIVENQYNTTYKILNIKTINFNNTNTNIVLPSGKIEHIIKTNSSQNKSENVILKELINEVLKEHILFFNEYDPQHNPEVERMFLKAWQAIESYINNTKNEKNVNIELRKNFNNVIENFLLHLGVNQFNSFLKKIDTAIYNIMQIMKNL